ncbi:hypothetical protein HK096_011083 [Nowakowskiella sp. JEL0078]|nr:hypothetical protein HK096_011083 [Nowakowskiella sp. JEL0078]
MESEGICPVKFLGSDAVNKDLHSIVAKTSSTAESNTEEGIRANQAIKTTKFYETLRYECQTIEDHMRDAEFDVLKKEEDAFLTIRFEHEISRMQTLQAAELRGRKVAFEKQLAARATRQKAKRAQKQLFRDIKKRDSTITEQEESASATEKIQEQLSDRSKQFEQQIAFVEAKHEKQRKQLIAAQERKLSAEKTLHDLETKHLKTELRSTLAKNFQARVNHQKALDKRMMDHQRERQLLELRQLKERADLEEKSFEEIQSLKISQNSRGIEMQGHHLSEMHTEKDRLYEIIQLAKVAALEKKYTNDVKLLSQVHRSQTRQLRQMNLQMMKQRKYEATKGKDAREESETSLSVQPPITTVHNSQTNTQAISQRTRLSRSISRQGSQDSISQIGEDEDKMSESGQDDSSRLSVTGLARGVGGSNIRLRVSGPQLLEEGDIIEEADAPAISNLKENIKKLQSRQKEDLLLLLKSQKEEAERVLTFWQTKAKDLEVRQVNEMNSCKETQSREINEMIIAQEREIQMEAAVHDTEMKMLLERRLLNSVLNTVVDAIITIDPIGTIKRFNGAAEKMFGYLSNEVIERNIRDLMPEKYSVCHDDYLLNYMTTGVKKVIGSGRRAFGMRKDRSTFPIHLSISEVKDESVHLFTGIVRDMTNEVENEERQEAAEAEKKAHLQKLSSDLDASKERAQRLLSSVLPVAVSRDYLSGKTTEPQFYDSCTILFCEIIGFAQLCSRLSPEKTINLLNSVHKNFDDVIAQYDAYKVDSTGNSYTVVSGLPDRNGNAHSGIIATIAFHLMSVAAEFKDDDLNEGIQLHIALNTGLKKIVLFTSF